MKHHQESHSVFFQKKNEETEIIPYVEDKESSSNIAEKLSEFLCGINPNEIEEDDKVQYYTDLLKDYKAWFIFSKEKDHIIAVMIIDDNILMNKSKCFHLLSIAVSPQYERKGYGSSLLRKWARERVGCNTWRIYVTCPNVDDKGVFILEGMISCLDDGSVVGHFFLKNSFSIDEEKNFGIDKKWRRKNWVALSFTIFSLKGMTLRITFDVNSDDIFLLHNPNIISKLKCKIVNGKDGLEYSFYGKNNCVGEFEIERDKVEGIPASSFKYVIDQAKNSETKTSNFHHLPAGKKDSYATENFDEDLFDMQYVVPKKYQYAGENNGECMLYALLLLLHTDDLELSSKLLHITQGGKKEKFKWLHLFKGGEFGKFINQNTHYNLRHGKNKNGHKLWTKQDYMNTIFNNNEKRKWVAILEDKNGSANYAVGFDCKRKIIWDYSENYAIKLKKENLDICCGKFTRFSHIKSMGFIEKKN